MTASRLRTIGNCVRLIFCFSPWRVFASFYSRTRSCNVESKVESQSVGREPFPLLLVPLLLIRADENLVLSLRTLVVLCLAGMSPF
ncbi:hypothetical protein EDB86DRAFT_2955823 [Lactarius hatsudake]|nr:hypothetical protein EDB86DRAFT_2955823 [Lactarius hatsudake]